jgi:hypothetical protein
VEYCRFRIIQSSHQLVEPLEMLDTTSFLQIHPSRISQLTGVSDIQSSTRGTFGHYPPHKMKYFTAEEIAMHNTADDCWVSIYEKVYDLTRLIKANRDLLADPIISAAGSSISHWFREDTRDIKTFIDPQRNIRMPYTPHGRFTHVPSPDPLDNCAIVDTPWWVDSNYVVGQVEYRITQSVMKFSDTYCDKSPS